MKKYTNRCYHISIALFVSFILWTAAVCTVDVKPIGPYGTKVGFAAINSFIHSLTGVNWLLYFITDRLSIIPFAIAVYFALLGFIQLIKRKSIKKVDSDILALGVFYVVVIALYLFFEICIINYRPVLIDGVVEASYPSSTTVLVLCVMLTALIQSTRRIKNKPLKMCIKIAIIIFTVFMVAGRFFSGVHWLTDIIGGMLISASLVSAYYAVV